MIIMVRQAEAAYEAAECRLAVAMEEEEACDELVQVRSMQRSTTHNIMQVRVANW